MTDGHLEESQSLALCAKRQGAAWSYTWQGSSCLVIQHS